MPRLLWNQRIRLLRALGIGLLLGLAIAFLLPKRYQSTTRLMPPDNNRSLPMAMLAGVAGNMLALPGADLLGIHSSGALFIGVLRSETVEDRLIDRFGLRRVYGERLKRDTRDRLRDNTGISEDIKSGILEISVLDSDPARAAALAQAYVEELNRVNAELTTSAAHRERVFIEERLRVVKQDLDDSAQALSRFASENTTVDIPEQMKAMVGAAATLEGQFIEAQSELSAMRQVYSENNVRVRARRARIAELQSQLNKLRGSGPSQDGRTDSPAPYPSIRQLPLLGVKYADLYRRTKIQEVVYETLSLVTIMMGLLCVGVAAGWTLATAFWSAIDSEDPTRVFLEEVFRSFHPRNLRWPLSGLGARALYNKISHNRRHCESLKAEQVQSTYAPAGWQLQPCSAEETT